MVLLLTMLVGAGSSVWAEDVTIISADFENTDGWTLSGKTSSTSNKIGTGKSLQIASGKGEGSATSPAFSSLVGSTATLTFQHISSGSASRTLTITGNNCKVNGENSTTVTVGTEDVGSSTISITEATTSSTITFSAASNQGTVIDNVLVYYTVANSPLESIAVSGSYQTVFTQGETFNHEGVVVTATYENDYTSNVTENATFSTPDMSTLGTKTVTVSYTENNLTKTTSYDITVNAPATLTGISLSGDYPTSFYQNSTFSHSGLIVTASYDDNTTKDVTSSVSVSNPDLTTTGFKTVTVSYTENNVSMEATYDITVTEYVQPTNITANLNEETFLTYTSGNSNVKGEHLYTIDNVTLTGWSNTSASSTIASYSSHVRFYAGSHLKIEAPANYDIIHVEFTEPSSNATWNSGPTTVSSGKYNNSNKTWEGKASSIQFDFTDQNRIASVIITLAIHVESYTFNFNSSPVTGGTIEVLDENADEVTTGDKFVEGAELTVSATANTGYTFSNWTATGLTIAEGNQTNTDLTVTMPANEVTLTANFTPNTYDLNMTSDHGTLTVTVNGEAWTEGTKIAYGAEVNITATADTDWILSSWSTVGVTLENATQNPVSFTMPANDVMIEAEYTDISAAYTVTYYVAGEENEVKRVGGAILNLPEPSAVNGMTFAGWSESNDLTGSITFVSNNSTVNSDMTLYAIFYASNGGNIYVKQTSGAVESGDYLIVYETGSVAFNGALTTLDSANNNISISIDNGVIEGNNDIDAAVFTIDAINGTILSASGYFIGVSSYGNGLKTTQDPSTYSNTFSFDEDGNAVIIGFENASGNMHLRFNKANNDMRFRYYKDGGQQPIALYKKTVGAALYSLGQPETVSITAAKYATFSAAQPVDFSESGITVYTAQVEGNVVKISAVADGIVPANTGVIIYSDEVKTNVSIPATSCSKILANNELVATVTRTLVSKTDGSKFNYIMQKSGDNILFNMATATGAYMPAGKAYLSTSFDASANGARLNVVFNDDATGISVVNRDNINNLYHNIQGQLVTNPTNGLYIVNGKKVIIK